MICAHCKTYRPKTAALMLDHWNRDGCIWGRPLWKRVLQARRDGHSGRRLLHAAFPDLWPSVPMDEEAKDRLRELAEARKEAGVKTPRRRIRLNA